MSRSGYTDDCENLNLYRAAVANATRGKRGQKLLRDLRDALGTMPVKRLIRNELEENGEVCALGALGRVRGIDMTTIDADEPDEVAAAFGVARALAAEIEFMNDEWGDAETPEALWQQMYEWVCEQITKPNERPSA